jgi:hypothetical protein
MHAVRECPHHNQERTELLEKIREQHREIIEELKVDILSDESLKGQLPRILPKHRVNMAKLQIDIWHMAKQLWEIARRKISEIEKKQEREKLRKERKEKEKIREEKARKKQKSIKEQQKAIKKGKNNQKKRKEKIEKQKKVQKLAIPKPPKIPKPNQNQQPKPISKKQTTSKTDKGNIFKKFYPIKRIITKSPHAYNTRTNLRNTPEKPDDIAHSPPAPGIPKSKFNPNPKSSKHLKPAEDQPKQQAPKLTTNIVVSKAKELDFSLGDTEVSSSSESEDPHELNDPIIPQLKKPPDKF